MRQTRLFSLLLSAVLVLPLHAQERRYTRLKGYYRVYQATNSLLSYFVDGMMEFYVPVPDSTAEGAGEKKGAVFVDRKILGERRRKAPEANGDDTFIRISLPGLERQTLLESISGEEYSTRNNGDVYRWADKCGKITREQRKHHRW